jgi:hypothetical protein
MHIFLTPGSINVKIDDADKAHLVALWEAVRDNQPLLPLLHTIIKGLAVDPNLTMPDDVVYRIFDVLHAHKVEHEGEVVSAVMGVLVGAVRK